MVQYNAPYVPESLGYDSSRIPVLNRFFQEQTDNGRLIGASYAMARDGKLFAAGAVGKQSFRAEDKRPLKPESIFRIASVTKLFTAAAVFQLIEDGLCRLDEPMCLHLPEMENEDFRDVTIAQVLSHTSGLSADHSVYPDDEKRTNPWDCIGQEFESGGKDWITAGLRAGKMPEGGKRWEYSSFGYVLLGEMIRRLSGVHSNQYIEQNIIEPCGMSDSGFWETVKKLPRFKNRFFIHYGGAEKALENEEESTPWDAIPGTGSGLHSTVIDLVKFGNMLQNGGRINGRRVLGRLAIQKMTSLHSNLPNFCWNAGGALKYYGYGPDLIMDDMYIHSPGTYNHEGWGRVRLSVDPTEKLVSAYFIPLTNPEEWDPVTAFNPQAIICSGIM